MNIEDTITRIFADHSVDAELTSSQALSYIGSDYQTLTILYYDTLTGVKV